MEDGLVLQQLIASAQVLGIQNDPSLPADDRQILRVADQEKRALSAREVRQLCRTSTCDAQLIEHLQNQANHLVQQARELLIREQPHLVETGGALFPSERADACWRDCWNFLRVILYAVACRRTTFTNPEGMLCLRALYTHLGVPLEGLNIALKELKTLSVFEVANPVEAQLLNDAFDHLIEVLNKTAVKT
jgi:hypothetical protein